MSVSASPGFTLHRQHWSALVRKRDGDSTAVLDALFKPWINLFCSVTNILNTVSA